MRCWLCVFAVTPTVVLAVVFAVTLDMVANAVFAVVPTVASCEVSNANDCCANC